MSVRIQYDEHGKPEVVITGRHITAFEWMQDGDTDRDGVALWGSRALTAFRQAAAELERSPA